MCRLLPRGSHDSRNSKLLPRLKPFISLGRKTGEVALVVVLLSLMLQFPVGNVWKKPRKICKDQRENLPYFRWLNKKILVFHNSRARPCIRFQLSPRKSKRFKHFSLNTRWDMTEWLFQRYESIYESLYKSFYESFSPSLTIRNTRDAIQLLWYNATFIVSRYNTIPEVHPTRQSVYWVGEVELSHVPQWLAGCN